MTTDVNGSPSRAYGPQDRPTLESIQATKQFLREQWSAAHATFDRMDTLANRTFQIWPSEINRPTYYPSTPANIISHAVDRLLTFNPRFYRPPHRDTQQSRDWADRIENTADLIWRDSTLKEVAPTHKTIGTYMAKYGYAVQRVRWNLDNKPAEPERDDYDTQADFDSAMDLFKAKSQNFNPYEITAPHPRSVLLSMEKQPEIAIHFVSMPAWQLQRLTERMRHPSPGVTRNSVAAFRSDDPYKLVDVLFYWTRDWVAAMTNPPTDRRGTPELLYSIRNAWGLQPYSHAFSGFGSESGHNIGDPDALANGLLRDAEDSIIKQAQAHSAMHNILIRDAFAPLVSTREPTDLIDALQRGIIQGDPNEFGYFPTILQNITSSISQIAGVIDQDIELATFNRILAGFRDEGVSTVGQTAIFAQAADRRFDVLAQQMAHLATIASQNLLQLIDVTDTPIGLNGQRITPNIIERDYTLTASFESIDPAAQQQERQMSMAEFDRQLIDRRTYLREARRTEDIETIIRGVDEDRARSDPFVQMAFARLAMQRIGDAEIQSEAERIRREFQQQSNQNGGRSPNPQGASPGGSRPAQEVNVDRLRQSLTPDAVNPARQNGSG